MDIRLDFKPTKNDEEFNALIESDAKNLIRSMDHWNDFLNLHPLVSCDKETIQEFTENLAFKDGALAEAKYDVLTDKLPPDQIKTLFQFFGIDDYQEKINYRCDNCGGEATCCTPAVGYICTDHC